MVALGGARPGGRDHRGDRVYGHHGASVVSAAGRGRFVVLEGDRRLRQEHPGPALAAALRERGETVVETREPGGTALGERLREVLLDSAPGDVSPMRRSTSSPRPARNWSAEVIRPALIRGEWVVCDRFLASSLVYQGVARGLGVDAVARANELAVARCVPDLRAHRRGPAGDRARPTRGGRPDRGRGRRVPSGGSRTDTAARHAVSRAGAQRRRLGDARRGACPRDARMDGRVIAIPDQPLADEDPRRRDGGTRVPQQFLLYGPAGTGKRQTAARSRALDRRPAGTEDRAQMDLSVVRASGAQILLEDLEDALRDLAARPVVGRCRVVIVEGAERLRLVGGGPDPQAARGATGRLTRDPRHRSRR